MKKKKKKHVGAVQGYALLYGRSSRAIRIVNGEIVGRADKQNHSPKKYSGTVKSVQKVQNIEKARKTPKRYVMSEDTKRKLDNLQDPLAMISRFERAQKLLPLRGVKLSFVPSLEFLRYSA